VSRKELLRRTRDGLVTVIDTRPLEESSAGHLAGAMNVPLAEPKRWLAIASLMIPAVSLVPLGLDRNAGL